MKKQRNQVIIKNEFQKKLIMSTLLITLITLNVIIMTAFLIDSIYGSKDAMFDVFSLAVACLELVAVVIVYYVGRKISFHIAGPVYAIERTLKQMDGGDLAQSLKLRPGDHFVEVADAINSVIANYRERIIRVDAILKDGVNELTPIQAQLLRDEMKWFITVREPS